MTDLAKKYTKQLEKSQKKDFVLSRMIAEVCRVSLPLRLVRHLCKQYGEYTVYNAVFPTAEWVFRSNIKDQMRVFKYLTAVCRNLQKEELEITQQQEALERQTEVTKSVSNEIKEIHDRKRASKGRKA